MGNGTYYWMLRSVSINNLVPFLHSVRPDLSVHSFFSRQKGKRTVLINHCIKVFNTCFYKFIQNDKKNQNWKRQTPCQDPYFRIIHSFQKLHEWTVPNTPFITKHRARIVEHPVGIRTLIVYLPAYNWVTLDDERKTDVVRPVNLAVILNRLINWINY